MFKQLNKQAPEYLFTQSKNSFTRLIQILMKKQCRYINELGVSPYTVFFTGIQLKLYANIFAGF